MSSSSAAYDSWAAPRRQMQADSNEMGSFDLGCGPGLADESADVQ